MLFATHLIFACQVFLSHVANLSLSWKSFRQVLPNLRWLDLTEVAVHKNLSAKLMHEHWTYWLRSVLEKQYYGHWCRYRGTGELITCFDAERVFVPYGDSGVIHRNIFHYDSGTVRNCTSCGPWLLKEEECSLPDGVSHPARPDQMRTLVVPNGSGAWLTPTINDDEAFGAEMFLHHGDFLRMSIVAMHHPDGRIGNLSFIREDTRGHSIQIPSPDWTTCTELNCHMLTPAALFTQMLGSHIQVQLGEGDIIDSNLVRTQVFGVRLERILLDHLIHDDILMLLDDKSVALILPRGRRKTCRYSIIWRVGSTLRTITLSWIDGKIHSVQVLRFSVFEIGVVFAATS